MGQLDWSTTGTQLELDRSNVTGRPVTSMDDRLPIPSPVTADEMDRLKAGGFTLTSYKLLVHVSASLTFGPQ